MTCLRRCRTGMRITAAFSSLSEVKQSNERIGDVQIISQLK